MTVNKNKAHKKSPTDPDIRKQVKLFRHYVWWLKNLHFTIKELFESPKTTKLLDATACSFFRLLNEVLIDYFLLEASKITDSSRVPRKMQERFSVENLLKEVKWSQDNQQKLQTLRVNTQHFRDLILPARNALLAHIDKDTVMNDEDKMLGHFPEGEDLIFMTSLEEICNIFHQESFGEVAGNMVPNHSGDVLDLLKVMTNGLAFQKTWKDSQGEDFDKLRKTLEQVQNNF